MADVLYGGEEGARVRDGRDGGEEEGRGRDGGEEEGRGRDGRDGDRKGVRGARVGRGCKDMRVKRSRYVRSVVGLT